MVTLNGGQLNSVMAVILQYFTESEQQLMVLPYFLKLTTFFTHRRPESDDLF